MAELKTKVNDASVSDFINSVDDEQKRTDSRKLVEIFRKITKEEPKMWGTSIIGFGKYHYKSDRSAQEGDWPLTGFSPRKQSLTLYIMLGFERYAGLLQKLGKHKTSKSCLYINKLEDADMAILEELIKKSYIDMKESHTV